MDNLDEVRDLKDAYESVLDDADEKRTAYHAAIRRLYLRGVPLRAIADELGISYQRVHQIVGEEPPARKKRRAAGKTIGVVFLVLGIAGGLVVSRTWRVMAHQSTLRVAPSNLPHQLMACRAPCPNTKYFVTYESTTGKLLEIWPMPPELGEEPIVMTISKALKQFPNDRSLKSIRQVYGTRSAPARRTNIQVKPIGSNYWLRILPDDLAVLNVRGNEAAAIYREGFGHFYVNSASKVLTRRRDYRPLVVAVVGVFLAAGLTLVVSSRRSRQLPRRREGQLVPSL